jgi:hypothetical protein
MVAVAMTVGLVLSSCSNQDVTRSALQADVSTVYARLHQKRQQLQGAPTTEVRVAATCYRGGPDQPDIGPGKDWRCDLKPSDSNGQLPDVTYLVNARTNGCWAALIETLAATADNVDVATMIDPRTGKSVTDPLGGFDGCLRA